ncbi:MAG: septum formation initiator family protein [Pseudomonadota bacterium]
MRFSWASILAPTFMLSVVGYFAYHMVVGNHGLKAWSAVEQQLETSKIQLARLQAQQEKLAHKVALLRPDSLCPDLLEEQARKILGVASPNEIVVLRPEDVR